MAAAVDQPQARALGGIDQTLGLVAQAKTKRHPIQWLEDSLLDLRAAVSADE